MREKSPAVRFIHLNDSQAEAAESAQSHNKSGHHSAFQQLFPRARKLLQELPEAEIQRLTTAARANNGAQSGDAAAAATNDLK